MSKAKELIKLVEGATNQFTLEFYECEHGGDLENIENDLVNSGATIIDSDVDEGAEVCRITFTVTDKNQFLKKFKLTDSYDFIN